MGRNIAGRDIFQSLFSRRPPCEGVGRNYPDGKNRDRPIVALHVRAWVEIYISIEGTGTLEVALHVRAWVEMASLRLGTTNDCVALHVRAWVEIIRSKRAAYSEVVALHVRAWVEIASVTAHFSHSLVALHVRAWVEIISSSLAGPPRSSGRPPCEGVGRNMIEAGQEHVSRVALHVRAWVEMVSTLSVVLCV